MANDALNVIRKRIDGLLYSNRPDRYDVRPATEEGDEDGGSSDWLDAIADEIAEDLPTKDVRKVLARSLVRQREGQATRSANSLLRKFAQDGQLMLGWWEQERQPVAVVTRTQRPGKDPEVHEERVALGAMTPQDFRAFANEERIRAGRDFASRNATCDAAEDIAKAMLRGRFARFAMWAESVAPRDEEATTTTNTTTPAATTNGARR